MIKLVEDMDHGLNAVLEQASAVPIHTRECPHKSGIGSADERRTSAPPLRLQMTERLDMIGQQKMLLMLELQVLVGCSRPSVPVRRQPITPPPPCPCRSAVQPRSRSRKRKI